MGYIGRWEPVSLCWKGHYVASGERLRYWFIWVGNVGFRSGPLQVGEAVR